VKISINKKVVNGPWGGGNQILMLLVDFLVKKGFKISYSLDNDTSVILIMDVKDESCSFSIKQIREFKKNKNVKIIQRINDNGSHRKNNEWLDDLIINVNKEMVDKTIFISKWIKNYFEAKGLKRDNSVVIANGADRKLFYSYNNQRNKDDPLRIVTHHWSRNMAKGYEIYDKLDKFCCSNPDIAHFRFIGRPLEGGILSNCEKIYSKPYKEIGQFLRTEDIYVTATQYESGGCHIVEGMACGLIPLVKRGGGGTENYVEGFGFYYDTFEELKSEILNFKNNYDIFIDAKNNMINYTYSNAEMCEQYWNVIKEME